MTIGHVTLFQPSEFMKISYILMLSRAVVNFLQRYKDRERKVQLDFFLIFELALLYFTRSDFVGIAE